MTDNQFSLKESDVNAVIRQLEDIITEMQNYQKEISTLEAQLVGNWKGEASEKFDKVFKGTDLEKMKRSIKYFLAFIKMLKDIVSAYKAVDAAVAVIFG